MIDGKGKPGIESLLRLKLTYMNAKKKHHGRGGGKSNGEAEHLKYLSLGIITKLRNTSRDSSKVVLLQTKKNKLRIHWIENVSLKNITSSFANETGMPEVVNYNATNLA